MNTFLSYHVKERFSVYCVCVNWRLTVGVPTEAQKNAEVAKIQYEQKIMEKESLKKMSLLEGTGK